MVHLVADKVSTNAVGIQARWIRTELFLYSIALHARVARETL